MPDRPAKVPTFRLRASVNSGVPVGLGALTWSGAASLRHLTAQTVMGSWGSHWVCPRFALACFWLGGA